MGDMDFENVNRFNSRVNAVCGNLLPIAADGSQFPKSMRLYSAAVWLLELVHIGAFLAGFVLSPREKALKDGTVNFVVHLEATFLLSRLYARRDLMERVIRQMNEALRNTDHTMKEIIVSVLKPVNMSFAIYAVISLISVVVWTAQPIVLISEKSTFFYVDYNLPAAFSAEPFTSRVLIPSTVVMTAGSVYLFLRKFGVDVYMIHLVLLLTAQYRYTAMKLAALFHSAQDVRDVSGEKYRLESDRRVENEMRELCRRQNTILRISIMLRKLLSVNFSLLYVNSVFRFCFIAVMMTTVSSLNFAGGVSVTLFALGSITQFFLLCSSAQTLSDASTEITDTAFNEGWYQFTSSIKHTFLMLIMTNNLECKIAAIEKFNLSLPSFMTIINQSYSIALLFLRAK